MALAVQRLYVVVVQRLCVVVVQRQCVVVVQRQCVVVVQRLCVVVCGLVAWWHGVFWSCRDYERVQIHVSCPPTPAARDSQKYSLV